MADNIGITPGTGATAAADDIGGVLYQRNKIALGLDGTHAADLSGTADRGAYVDPRLKVVRLSQTPTISTSAYALKDAVGGLMTFANAARASGGSCTIQAVQIIDKAQMFASLDLVLFDVTIAAPTDNAVFDPTDAELATCIGVIAIGGGFYSDFNDNAVAVVNNVGLECLLTGTDIFGVLVARTTPTYVSTSDLTVRLTIVQD